MCLVHAPRYEFYRLVFSVVKCNSSSVRYQGCFIGTEAVGAFLLHVLHKSFLYKSGSSSDHGVFDFVCGQFSRVEWHGGSTVCQPTISRVEPDLIRIQQGRWELKAVLIEFGSR